MPTDSSASGLQFLSPESQGFAIGVLELGRGDSFEVVVLGF